MERATLDDRGRAEIVEGGRRLAAKVLRYRPRFAAVLGIGAYRIAFGRPEAAIGRQELSIGPARLWALPSPSGQNAHYRFAALVSLYEELRRAAAEG